MVGIGDLPWVETKDMANALSARGFKGAVDPSRDPEPWDINADFYDAGRFSCPLADRSSGMHVGITPSMLARNGNIDVPAPLARNGSGGGTLVDVLLRSPKTVAVEGL